MSKPLIIVGLFFVLAWGGITALTFGWPQGMCDALKMITPEAAHQQIDLMQNGFHYPLPNNTMPTVAYLVIFTVLMILFFYIIRHVERTSYSASALVFICAVGVILRLITFFGVPIHENDIYRYVWDGKSALHGINPFKYAPADLFMYEYGYSEDYYDDYHDVIIKGRVFDQHDHQRLDQLLQLRDQKPVIYERIGHWQVPTIYPPVAQAVFLLSAWLKQDSLAMMKFIFILFDIGVIFIVVALLKHLHHNPCMSIVYGWCPLVIMQLSNSGHYDAVPIFWTMLTVLLIVKRQMLTGTAALALATLSKFFSGVLLPFLVRPWKVSLWILFGLILAALYIPYFLWDQTGFQGVFQGLTTYNKQWSYNASIFNVVYNLVDMINPEWNNDLIPAKMIVGIIYVGFLTFLMITHKGDDLRDTLHRCFLAIAVLFILNPVADPWYFCWVIPFLCLFPYRSWVLLSGLLVLSYLNFHSDFPFIKQKIWNISVIGWVTYIPFYGYLIYEWVRKPDYIILSEKRKDFSPGATE